MQTYAEFRPTVVDIKGLGLPLRQHWLVVPVTQHRDSDTLAQSNFATALALLGGESEFVEVHRFGHWGHGWFELVLVHPSLHEVVQEIEDSLEQYSVLDESDWSEREWEVANYAWDHMAIKDRIDVCKRFDVSIFAARHDSIPEQVELGYLTDRY